MPIIHGKPTVGQMEYNVNTTFPESIRNTDYMSSILRMVTDDDFLSTNWRKRYTYLYGSEAIKIVDLIINSIFSAESADFANYNDIRKANMYRMTLLSTAVAAIWLKSKKIYEPDTDFLKELSQTDVNRIYAESIISVPQQGFYLDLSKTDGYCLNTNGLTKKISGIFVTVVYEEVRGLPTLTVYLSYYSDDGQQQPDKIEFLLTEAQGDTEHPYFEYKQTPLRVKLSHNSNIAFAINQSDVDALRMLVIRMILYLHSKKPDISEKPARTNKKTPFMYNPVSDGVKEYTVGKKHGAIMRFRKKAERVYNSHRSIASSRKAPHAVKAHWHRYWVGEGRRKLEYRWIGEYLTGGTEGFIKTISVTPLKGKDNNGTTGEQLVSGALSHMGVEYVEQYYIPEIGKRYDFAAFLKGNKFCLIEYDGEQHYRPVKNWNFEKTKNSDHEKDLWAKEHGIPLLRIGYMYKEYISEALSNFSKALMKDYVPGVWITTEEGKVLRPE